MTNIILIFFMLSAILLPTGCSSKKSGDVDININTSTISWNRVTKDISDNDLTVDGYIIHHGPSADDLSKSFDAGNITSLALIDYLDSIPSDSKCFAISAYIINANSVKVEGQ